MDRNAALQNRLPVSLPVERQLYIGAPIGLALAVNGCFPPFASDGDKNPSKRKLTPLEAENMRTGEGVA